MDQEKKLKLWVVLMNAGRAFGCHQKCERSFQYHGYQFPLCARCTGIFFGQIPGMALFAFGVRVHWLVSALFIGIMAIDGLLQLWGIKASNNSRRLVTGLLSGFGFGQLLLSGFVWLADFF